jgi:cytochrome c oxidase subunit 2
MDGHQSTMVVDGPVAKEQLDVFLRHVLGHARDLRPRRRRAYAYATLKFRAAVPTPTNMPSRRRKAMATRSSSSGLIGASIFALVLIAVPTLKGIWYTYGAARRAEKANIYEVTGIGYQWWFKFEYPKEQIERRRLR